jgi:CubicO group peptidase (beta-lactamase class C family)
VRDLDSKTPADADTLYAIGSVTKSFTAAALGALADEGKLTLDQPVADLLPEFRLADDGRTFQVTVRDLLSHRTGLPRHDFGWYGDGEGLTREGLVKSLRHLEANTGLRQRWQYQNWMFMTAGYLAEKLDGRPWDEVVRARLLAPLGMTRANFSTAASAADPDHATPYEESKGVVRKVNFREFPAMAPAGAINASARDMAQWLRLHLGKGEVDGKRILSASIVEELHQAAMVMEEGGPDPEILAPRYALGWGTDVYRGHRRVQHGGNIDGFSALATFFPEDGVGVVVLANLGGSPAGSVISRTVSDRLLGLEPIDWLARIGARWDGARAAVDAAEGRAEELRRPGAPPPRPLAEYTGEYEHPGYGRIAVEHEQTPPRRKGDKPADRLVARFHGIEMPLEPWHFETFRATSNDPAVADLKLFLQFVPDASGEIERLDAPFEPLVAPLPFRKLPPARLSDPAFLAGLAGDYVPVAQPDQLAKVELAGTTLRLSLRGQPTYTLRPLRGVEFEIQELPDFRVRFVVDEKTGRASGLLFLQPEGVFAAKRQR